MLNSLNDEQIVRMKVFLDISREEATAKMESAEDRLDERVDGATKEDIKVAVDMLKLGLGVGVGEGEATEAENLEQVFSQRFRLMPCIIEDLQ